MTVVIIITLIICAIVTVPAMLGGLKVSDRRQENRQRRFDSEQRRKMGR